MFKGLFLTLLLLKSAHGQINNAGTLNNDGRMNKFLQLLDRAAISPSIGETIFAPTTWAWQQYREEDVERWNKYASAPEFFVHLRHLLLWHFVTEDRFSYEDIFDGRRGFMENTLGNITIDQQFKKMDNVHADNVVDANVTTTDGIIHILDKVIVPPYLAQDLIAQMLDDQSAKFAFSTMANLALWAGLDDKINGVYEHGITMLVPPNRRFNRAEIDVPALLTEDMKPYTRDLVLAHMIMDNYHEAGVFAMAEAEDTEQFLVTSELGKIMWITVTEGRLRFQSTDVLVTDQVAQNG